MSEPRYVLRRAVKIFGDCFAVTDRHSEAKAHSLRDGLEAARVFSEQSPEAFFALCFVEEREAVRTLCYWQNGRELDAPVSCASCGGDRTRGELDEQGFCESCARYVRGKRR